MLLIIRGAKVNLYKSAREKGCDHDQKLGCMYKTLLSGFWSRVSQ